MDNPSMLPLVAKSADPKFTKVGTETKKRKLSESAPNDKKVKFDDEAEALKKAASQLDDYGKKVQEAEKLGLELLRESLRLALEPFAHEYMRVLTDPRVAPRSKFYSNHFGEGYTTTFFERHAYDIWNAVAPILDANVRRHLVTKLCLDCQPLLMSGAKEMQNFMLTNAKIMVSALNECSIEWSKIKEASEPPEGKYPRIVKGLRDVVKKMELSHVENEGVVHNRLDLDAPKGCAMDRRAYVGRVRVECKTRLSVLKRVKKELDRYPHVKRAGSVSENESWLHGWEKFEAERCLDMVIHPGQAKRWIHGGDLVGALGNSWHDRLVIHRSVVPHDVRDDEDGSEKQSILSYVTNTIFDDSKDTAVEKHDNDNDTDEKLAPVGQWRVFERITRCLWKTIQRYVTENEAVALRPITASEWNTQDKHVSAEVVMAKRIMHRTTDMIKNQPLSSLTCCPCGNRVHYY